MRTIVIILGACWALIAYSLWPLTPHRSDMTALGSGIWLAPSYLLLSAFKGAAIPMRVFVGTALLILLVVGLRIAPGRIDMLEVYLFCPPMVALAVALCRAWGLTRKHRPAR